MTNNNRKPVPVTARPQTPGPWHWEYMSGISGGWMLVGPHGMPVLIVPHCSGPDSYNEDISVLADADKAVIAAAPSMAEFLLAIPTLGAVSKMTDVETRETLKFIAVAARVLREQIE